MPYTYFQNITRSSQHNEYSFSEGGISEDINRLKGINCFDGFLIINYIIKQYFN